MEFSLTFQECTNNIKYPSILTWQKKHKQYNNWSLHSQLKGSIHDCSCSVDTVDYFNNNKIYPRLRSLLVKDYFRFYKINLYKQCPFWEDDGKCAMRFCSVSPCADKDIPVGLRDLRSEAPHEKVYYLCLFNQY